MGTASARFAARAYAARIARSASRVPVPDVTSPSRNAFVIAQIGERPDPIRGCASCPEKDHRYPPHSRNRPPVLRAPEAGLAAAAPCDAYLNLVGARPASGAAFLSLACRPGTRAPAASARSTLPNAISFCEFLFTFYRAAHRMASPAMAPARQGRTPAAAHNPVVPFMTDRHEQQDI